MAETCAAAILAEKSDLRQTGLLLPIFPSIFADIIGCEY
jgi:hypothetical protein